MFFQISGQFFIRLFTFLLFSFDSSWNIPDSSPLLNICFVKIFSPVCFVLFLVYLSKCRSFIFWSSSTHPFVLSQIVLLEALFSNWRIIALQYCVGFGRTIRQISHRYPYTPLSWASLRPLRPTPLSHHRTEAELPVLYGNFPLAFYFTRGSV